MFDIFASTSRPMSELFYHRGDLNDSRLGELISRDPSTYEEAKCVLLGCPQDEGIRRNRGRTGAAAAPEEIRRAFYKLTPLKINTHELFDLGDTLIKPTLEETHDLQREIVRTLVRDGKTVIILGGGNDISYPDCSALALEVPDLLVFNIDAHLDVRADSIRNSGTPYRQLLEENLIAPARFFEMGYQPAANSPIYLDYLNEKGGGCFTLNELRSAGIAIKFTDIIATSQAEAIFWGVDIDAVRASDAPGVSAPSPIGFSAEEICELALLAGKTFKTRIIELTEVNPQFDIDHRTAKLVALMLHHFLAGRAEAK